MKVSHSTFLALFLIPLTLVSSCVEVPKKTKPVEMTAHADSGGLAMAMQGVRTVSLHPNARIVKPIPGRSVEQLRAELEGALQNTFASRGYALVEPEKADRLIAYAIGVTGELDDVELTKLFGISAGLNVSASRPRGGIVLALVNPRTRTVEWRGSGSGSVEKGREDRVRVASQIARAVDTLLELMPRRR